MKRPSKSATAIVDEMSAGTRLDVFLARRFGQELDLSRRQARLRIEEGSVTINGRRVTRLSRELRLGEKVEVRLETLANESGGWSLSRERILFEDQDIIAVDKPPGLPSQATLDPDRHHLVRAIENYLKNHGHDGYVGLHQRLDRETSGVIVFTKSRRANKGMAEQISNHRVTKIYHALARRPERSPGETWEVRNHLRKRAGHPARMQVTTSGGDLAQTSFRCLEMYPEAWLIEARPLTGRMHQIRVHLADLGLAILGDPLYGDRATAKRAPRLMLHAGELWLKHPVSGEELRFVAPLSSDFQHIMTAEKDGTR